MGLPTESHSPTYNAEYATLDGYMDDDIDWVLRTSVRLLNNEFPALNLSVLQRAYRDYIGVGVQSGYRSAAEIKRLAEVQRELDNHFASALYERLFDIDAYNGFRKFMALSISQMAYKDKLFLPICHLLFIRMLFGEIENIPDLVS